MSIIYDLYAIDQNGNEELKHQSDPADPEQFIYGVTEGLIEPLAKAIDGLEKGAGSTLWPNPTKRSAPTSTNW